MAELDQGGTVMSDQLIQTNLRVLSNLAPASPHVVSTDHVRIEVLRCPAEAAVQWRMPETKLGLMWVRDRRGTARVLSNERLAENLSAREANLWFFPEGCNVEGELIGCSATDCIGVFVEPSFVPPPVKSELAEPIVGFSDGKLGRTFNTLASQLAEPDELQPMYVDGWAMQVLADIRRAGRLTQSGRSVRASGLAPWQLRRAREMLLADISEHLPLAAMAAACRISVSHFARAFRVSTGMAPHQWLIAERIQTARGARGEIPSNTREVAMRTSASITASEHLPWAQAPALARFRPEPRLDVRHAVQGQDTRSSERRTEPAGAVSTEVSFGPFRLLPTQFLLLEGDRAVPLGSRALEILIVLLECPGKLVSKQELMARVWPNVFVEPTNLTVHISALRRTLRDGRDGNRFIINIPGRGYRFVASVAVVGRFDAVKMRTRASNL